MGPIHFDPVIFSLGPLQVRWYGLMYVVGFFIAGLLLRILSKEGLFKPGREKIDSLITHMLIGMFLGARLAYVFIYNWDYYSGHLSELFSVWNGGLSFHGAIAGLALGGYIFARKNKVPLLQVTDCAVIVGSQGVFFGRLGNFINGELYGRVTDSPLGVVFASGGPYPRHASQLYEAFMEGLLMFIILWLTRKKFKFYGVSTSIFFVGYSIARFIIEYFREADSQLGYYFGGTTTMGQILCFLLALVGLGVFLYAKKNREKLAISLNQIAQ